MSSKVIDMTVGSPTKHILRFAIPLFIGNLFQLLYNIVDSIVVGNYIGADALAAVGTCNSINFFCFSLSAGLSVGIGVVVAQFFGAKNEKMVKSTIANAFYILTVAALVVGTLAFIFTPQILHLLQCPEKILPDAATYMRVSCCCLIFIAWYNGVASILRALGDSKSPLYFLVVAGLLNIVLDLVFVLVCKWGVFGVAFATLIAQATSAIGAGIFAYKKISYCRLKGNELKPDGDIIKKTLKVGVPISMQTCFISISVMIMQGFVNSFGETVMAAYTITIRVEQIIQQTFCAIGDALTSYSGQNMGAGKIDRVKKGMHRGTVMALIVSAFFIPLFFLFGHNIIGLFVNNEPEVIRIGTIGLKISCIFYFPLGMIYIPRSILNGCGDAKFAFIAGLTEVVGRIGLAPILTSIPSIGFWGLWITTSGSWVITGAVCVIRYLSGVWKTKSVVSQNSTENNAELPAGDNLQVQTEVPEASNK